MEKSLSSARAKFNDLGMGVAERLNMSTSSFNNLIFSFCLTPNLCSSSIMRRPKSLNFTESWITACVPMRISIVPDSNSASIISLSFFLRFLVNTATVAPVF